MTSPSRLVLLSALLLAVAALAVAASSGAPLQRRLFSMPQAGDVPAVNVAEPATSADALSSTTSADASAAAPAAVDAAAAPTANAASFGGIGVDVPRHGCPFAFDVVERGPHSGDTVYTAATAEQKVRDCSARRQSQPPAMTLAF